MRWGVTKPNWRLLLCAVGAHKFDYMCANRDADRDTLRVCYTCERQQEREPVAMLGIGRSTPASIIYGRWKYIR